MVSCQCNVYFCNNKIYCVVPAEYVVLNFVLIWVVKKAHDAAVIITVEIKYS